MTGLPGNTQVWLAAGHTDMRRGFDGLAGLVQTALTANPYFGHVFVFRGKRGHLIKALWWEGQGLCLNTARLTASSWARDTVVDSQKRRLNCLCAAVTNAFERMEIDFLTFVRLPWKLVFQLNQFPVAGPSVLRPMCGDGSLLPF